MTSDRATNAHPTKARAPPPPGTVIHALAYHTGVTFTVSTVGGE